MGPIVATALVAEVGDWKAFSSGRNLAAWIGLVRGSVPRLQEHEGRRGRGQAYTIGCPGPYLAADFVVYSKACCQRHLLHIWGQTGALRLLWPLNPIVPNCCRDYRRT